MALKMIDTETGLDVAPGSERKTFRGEVVVVEATRAEQPGKSGRVLIRSATLGSREVYDKVVGVRVVAQ